MTVQQRRERERAERHDLILRTARELAEAEGWDAVTTRRLSQRIEYSQPVLYSHFANKDAIVAAVAEQGFAELAAAMAAARRQEVEPQGLLRAVVDAYLGFAEANPVLYDAMFTLDVGLRFAQPDSPPALLDGFDQLVRTFEALVDDPAEIGTFTEVAWAALHGLATLTRAGRLSDGQHEARVDLLVTRLLS
ncbi:TetR/AcrR family transcriptional regulator [Kutzneria sp. CA-103260]|uniref:TetR/AcrR family transcriptional regulator n=1 Tax=Kutzneria sp. CA-103260 TaxID=2802641 RepID=UPI001BAA2C61|nr:TetR/AcrR family transcriptional regulator [Kutzneria sp. CA-103260]QUQ72159.1 transcriptional regulator [Kutzneria sp. CA-103260]